MKRQVFTPGMVRVSAGIACAGVIVAGWAAWAQVGSNGIIRGCVASSGLIRGIDEATGTCRNGDQTLSWYSTSGAETAFASMTALTSVQGQLATVQSAVNSLQSQIASLQETMVSEAGARQTADESLQAAIDALAEQNGLTSFDQLRDLSCTRDGSTGAIAIAYEQNGDARLNCVLPPPPPSEPPADLMGTYSVSPISYTCIAGLTINVDRFVFTRSGDVLTVQAEPASSNVMTGTFSNGHFSVISTFMGPIVHRFYLEGTFRADGTWTGGFALLFSQPSFGCPEASYVVVGSRI